MNHSAAQSILDLSVRELLARLGSSDPAPGGGAAAALAGALGAALVQMTANLTLGKPRFIQVEPLARRLEARTADLKQRLGDLADADADAFAQVSAAYRLPRHDDAEKSARSAAIQLALGSAAAVPLQTARLCAAVLEAAEDGVPAFNPAVISDVLVGALLAHAGLESAAVNVEINLASMTDPGATERLAADLAEARAGAADRLARIEQVGTSRIRGGGSG